MSIWDDQHVGFGRKFGVDKDDLLVYLHFQTHTLFNETVKNFPNVCFFVDFSEDIPEIRLQKSLLRETNGYPP